MSIALNNMALPHNYPESTGYLTGTFQDNGNTCSFRTKTKTSAPYINLLPLKLNFQPEMIFNIFKKPLLRLLSTLLLSFPLKMLLDVIFGLLYRNYLILRPLEEYIGAAFITVLTLEIVFFIKQKLNRILPWEKSPTRRLGIELGINLPFMSAVIFLLSFLVNIYFIKSVFIKLSDQILTTLYYIIILVIIPAFTEFALFLLNKWKLNIAEMERYKKENAEYKFETLRTQLNPHFLFNSFNTLSSLIFEDQQKAANFIRDLSDVYRYVLENKSRDTILLSEEVRFIKSFVYLYQLRFDNKLSVVIQISDDLLHKLIAPMTLQLLVENAIKHNIISQKKPLEITITSNQDASIVVKNNLQKKNTEVISSEIGLKNIISRYAYLTGRPVEITENENEFVVKVPLI